MEANDILSIDETRLDEAWVHQPKLYFKYADQLAEARNRVDELKREEELSKAELEEAKAQLDSAIRSEPERFGMSGKVTEGAIKSVMLLQPEYKDANDAYNEVQKKSMEAKNEVRLLEALVSSLDQKKVALENLVRLHGQSYFSVPKAEDSEASREYSKQLKQAKARRHKGNTNDRTDDE